MEKQEVYRLWLLDEDNCISLNFQQLEADMLNHKEQVAALCTTASKLTASGHFEAVEIGEIKNKLKERYVHTCQYSTIIIIIMK